jgi:hypothetical protein
MKNDSQAALVSGAKNETVRCEPGQILKADSENPSHVMWAETGTIVSTGPKGAAWVAKLKAAKEKAKREAQVGELPEQPEE